jgi:hypothetical protein
VSLFQTSLGKIQKNDVPASEMSLFQTSLGKKNVPASEMSLFQTSLGKKECPSVRDVLISDIPWQNKKNVPASEMSLFLTSFLENPKMSLHQRCPYFMMELFFNLKIILYQKRCSYFTGCTHFAELCFKRIIKAKKK